MIRNTRENDDNESFWRTKNTTKSHLFSKHTILAINPRPAPSKRDDTKKKKKKRKKQRH